jgi:hypothetical protein
VDTYLDAAGLEKRFGGLGDNAIRPIQLRDVTTAERQAWIVTDWYVGQWQLHYWLHLHGFSMVVHQWFGGDAYLELWDRQPPEDTAHRVLLPWTAWTYNGRVALDGPIARTAGWTQISRRFMLSPRRAYTVLYQYQGTSPDLAMYFYRPEACSAAGTERSATSGVIGMVRPIGEETYQQSRDGRWSSQPFGFVPPAGTGCGVLRLRTWTGTHAWRRVTVVPIRGS